MSSIQQTSSPASFAPIDSPRALWNRLQKEAALELWRGETPGRDADLDEAVRKLLQKRISHQPTFPTVSALLDFDERCAQPSLSPKHLLQAVLEEQRGFAAMLRDILEVLVDAKAPGSEHSLRVLVELGDGTQPLDMLLDAFREPVEKISRVLATDVVVTDPGLLDFVISELHNIAEPALPREDDKKVVAPKVQDLRASAWIAPTEPPRCGEARIDELWGEFLAVVESLRNWGSGFGETRDIAYRQLQEQKDDPVLRELMQKVHDQVDGRIVDHLHVIAKGVAAGELEAGATAFRLETIVAQMPSVQTWIDRRANELSELLKLPAWKRRYELYSVWVGSVLLKTARERALDFRFNVQSGVLSFAFGGSRLATFNSLDQAYEIRAELRTPLVGESKARNANIQPDFRVLTLPESADRNADTLCVVECKHYLEAKPAHFTAAANDYARSCGKAQVLVINHGEGDDAELRKNLEKPLAGRVTFVNRAQVRQANGEMIAEKFAEAVFGEPFRALASQIGFIVVAWKPPLQDVDLELHAIEHSGKKHVVSWQSAGDPFVSPHARLSPDVRQGPGKERIDVAEWSQGEYQVIVRNFSGEGTLSDALIECSVTIDDRLFEFRPSADNLGCVWSVCRLSVRDGHVILFPSKGTVAKCRH